jgi:hypothetical protein
MSVFHDWGLGCRVEEVVGWVDCARNGNNDDKHILGENKFGGFVSMDVDTFSNLAVHLESAI